MKKILKSFLIGLVCLVSIFSVTACGGNNNSSSNTIVIPDICELDESTAKTLLASKGLIPKIAYDYDYSIEEGLVIKTVPSIGSSVSSDDVVTIYISKGKRFYYLLNAVGYMKNVKNIDPFVWGDGTNEGTKEFYTPYVEEGYLYLDMLLRCTSSYSIEFYCGSDSSKSKGFGTASINDTFDKTVPIDVLFDNYVVNNKGGDTNFQVKIPLTDLGVQKPTNIYIEFDFLVNGVRQTFEAGFDLSW